MHKEAIDFVQTTSKLLENLGLWLENSKSLDVAGDVLSRIPSHPNLVDLVEFVQQPGGVKKGYDYVGAGILFGTCCAVIQALKIVGDTNQGVWPIALLDHVR